MLFIPLVRTIATSTPIPCRKKNCPVSKQFLPENFLSQARMRSHEHWIGSKKSHESTIYMCNTRPLGTIAKGAVLLGCGAAGCFVSGPGRRVEICGRRGRKGDHGRVCCWAWASLVRIYENLFPSASSLLLLSPLRPNDDQTPFSPDMHRSKRTMILRKCAASLSMPCSTTRPSRRTWHSPSRRTPPPCPPTLPTSSSLSSRCVVSGDWGGGGDSTK